MQKLIIADDERVIRETIYNLIDWESLGIEVIGLCKDGIEAYNMVLDESPDIVMTDIRMPGLSGLELVKRTAQTDQQIQFIILSGYEEFEYAREAMKYGVKHYLLKPYNESKLLESIQQAREDCRKARMQVEKQRQQNEMLYIIHQDALYHLIIDGIFIMEESQVDFQKYMKEQIRVYDSYLNFDEKKCYLQYLYYLEQKYLEGFLEKMEEYRNKKKNSSIFYGIYVKNTLLLFSREKIEAELLREWCGDTAEMVEIKTEGYENLSELLENALNKVRRYDMIYVIHHSKAIAILNNQNSLRYIQNICRKLESNAGEMERCTEELLKAVRETSQYEQLQMLGNSICVYMAKLGACSIAEETRFIRDSNQEQNMEKLKQMTVEMILEAKRTLCRPDQEYGILTERVMAYVQEHLADSDLTLKKIAEEYLYMNVDYVSRKFRKSTGEKFSQYLTEQRVERAKELLIEGGGNKIQYVAERVGCGNNPQYFSQIFKKIVGTTPGKWAQQMSEK